MPTASESLESFRPTIAEIDLDAFRENLQAIRELLPQTSRLIAVLKADAYGHGAVELARICEADDVEMLAVALIEEAIEISDAGVTLPILILGSLNQTQITEAVARRFIIGIVSPEELELAAAVAERGGVDVRIHLKLDSGMGRMGVIEPELRSVAEVIRAQPRLKVDAIYTHYANASDPNDRFTDEQDDKFRRMLATLARHGITAPLHHLGNSAATMRHIIASGDYARTGLALYGGEPLDVGTSRLRPLLKWKTKIARLKWIEEKDVVGYGSTWTARRRTHLATLPVGYADGYNRLLSNRGSVLVRGQRAPVVGRVSMDLVTIDVTDIDGVMLGDGVTLLGRDGDDEISAEEIANLTGTISYEVFCAISARVPRLYRSGEEIGTRSNFAVAKGESES